MTYPHVCSVCSDIVREDAALDAYGDPIHADCATCDCCGHTLGTCNLICDMADNEGGDR